MSDDETSKFKRRKSGTTLTKTEIADHHLSNFEYYLQERDFGQSFSSLSSALSTLPSLKEAYYSSFLEVFEPWSTAVEEDHGFQEAVKLYKVALKLYPESPDVNYLLAKILYSQECIMSQDVWRALFRECLNGRGSQYCDEVAPLLVAVDQGIKPSLLWDVCTADTSALLCLLNQAQSKGLLISKLALIELDLDVLIVNIDALTQTLTSITSASPTWLIDISEATPKVSSSENHQKFRVHLNSLISQLGVLDCKTSESSESSAKVISQSASNSCSSGSRSSRTVNTEASQHTASANPPGVKAIQVKLPSDINLSTVFGCMLGYPHIYWWEGESDGKSLSGMPLKVFKFSANCSIDGSLIELFSFSIPEAMEIELRPGIEHWGNVMNMKVEEAGSFSSAKFKCDSVLCLSVAL